MELFLHYTGLGDRERERERERAVPENFHIWNNQRQGERDRIMIFRASVADCNISIELLARHQLDTIHMLPFWLPDIINLVSLNIRLN